MGVAAQVGENLRGTAERPLGVDDPVQATPVGQSREGGGFSQRGELAEEARLLGVEGRVEALEEQAAEQSRQRLHGRKKPRRPAIQRCRRATAAARDDAVEVRMMRERLPPGVQDRRRRRSATPSRLGSAASVSQGLGGGLEKDVIDAALFEGDGGDAAGR